MTNLEILLSIILAISLATCRYLHKRHLQLLHIAKISEEKYIKLYKENEHKKELISKLSHEIRNPMGAILNSQETIFNNHTLSKEEKAILQGTHDSAKSMVDMLDQVLSFSKLDAGQFRIKEQAYDLKNLIQSIYNSFTTNATQKGLKIKCFVSEEISQSLIFDAAALRQILQNLISNAIKFTHHGEIIISAELLANDHFGQIIEFKVADTGIGIEPDDQARILKPFTQSCTQSQTYWLEGSGLGLSIVNHLTQLMNSQLHIDSSLDMGSTIRFTLGLKRSTDKPSYPKSIVKNIKTYDQIGMNQYVLLIDDHQASRLITESQLRAFGFSVASFSEIEEARKALREKRFNILVTDFSLPHINGIEFAKEVRMHMCQKIRIYGITANIKGQNQLIDSSGTFDGVLIKPTSMIDLHTELNLEKMYISNLMKVSNNNTEMLKTISKELLINQSEALLFLSQSSTKNIGATPLKNWAHKLRGGAYLSKDNQLIDACKSIEEDLASNDRNKKRTLMINLIRSNQILEKICQQALI
jgi:two-component system, NarL family, sensor histidine kinase EvgS